MHNRKKHPSNIFNGISKVLNVVLVLILFFSIILIFFTINEDLINNLNTILSIFGFAVGIVTIYLLYKNYLFQFDEFKQIRKSSNKANDLQVILYEKQQLQIEFENKIIKDEKIVGGKSESFYVKISNLGELIYKVLQSHKRRIEILSHCKILKRESSSISILDIKHIKKEEIDNYQEENIRHLLDSLNSDIQMLNFIIRYNAKLKILENNLNDKDSMALLVDFLPQEFLSLLSLIYNNNFKGIYNRFFSIEENCLYFDYEHAIKFNFIVEKTPQLKKLVNNYFDSLGGVSL
jgi:hypothetical protein